MLYFIIDCFSGACPASDSDRYIACSCLGILEHDVLLSNATVVELRELRELSEHLRTNHIFYIALDIARAGKVSAFEFNSSS